MSELEYLREEIAESRHKELRSFLLLFIGLFLFMVAVYLGTYAEIDFVSIKTPYEHVYIYYNPHGAIGIGIGVFSIGLMVAGAILIVYYVRDRSMIMAMLREKTREKSGEE
jgi:nitrate reductase NapE component